MTVQWKLNKGDSITVTLFYEVMGTKHKINLFLQNVLEAVMAPEEVAQLLGDRLTTQVFNKCLAEKSQWRSIRVIVREGKVSLPLTMAGAGELDTAHNLRFYLTRYNKDYPLSFSIYGISTQLDLDEIAEEVFTLATTDIAVTKNFTVRLSGFANTAQITVTNYVVNVSCKLGNLPENKKISPTE